MMEKEEEQIGEDGELPAEDAKTKRRYSDMFAGAPTAESGRKVRGRFEVPLRERFWELVAKVGGLVIGKYINSTTAIECQCPHGNKSTRVPVNFVFNQNKIKTVCPKVCRRSKLLKNAYPLMFAQLDPANNPGINLETLPTHFPAQLKWTCRLHTTCDEHQWVDTISNRIKLYEKRKSKKQMKEHPEVCPYCIGNAKLFCRCTRQTDLLEYSHPEIFAMIDRSKHTDDKELKDMRNGCNKELWFKCPKPKCTVNCPTPHEWKKKVCFQVYAPSCPFCQWNGHHQLCYCQSIAANEILSLEFDAEQNKPSVAAEISIHSIKPIWWKCSKHTSCDSHVWRKSPSQRMNFSSHCPWCRHLPKQICPCEMSVEKCPRLIRDWDHKKNSSDQVQPQHYHVNSSLVCGWKCFDCDHRWNAEVKGRFHGKGCPRCAAERSRPQMESKAEETLKKLAIKFIPDHPFPDCKFKNCLRFDFYLPDLNALIEVDGTQHFEECQQMFNPKEFPIRQQRDKIKNDYAVTKGLSLLRVASSKRVYVATAVMTFINELKSRPVGNISVIHRYLGNDRNYRVLPDVAKPSEDGKKCPMQLPHTFQPLIINEREEH